MKQGCLFSHNLLDLLYSLRLKSCARTSIPLLKQILSNLTLIAVEITGDGDGEISLAVGILPEARIQESKPFPSDKSRRPQNLSASRSQIPGKRLPRKTSIRFLILSSRPGLLGGAWGCRPCWGWCGSMKARSRLRAPWGGDQLSKSTFLCQTVECRHLPMTTP
jgi:hypothetical protein